MAEDQDVRRTPVAHIYETLQKFEGTISRVEQKLDATNEKLDTSIHSDEDHEARLRALEAFRERTEGAKGATQQNFSWVWQALTFAATFGLAVLVYLSNTN